jgi:hypothetical protein
MILPFKLVTKYSTLFLSLYRYRSDPLLTSGYQGDGWVIDQGQGQRFEEDKESCAVKNHHHLNPVT